MLWLTLKCSVLAVCVLMVFKIFCIGFCYDLFKKNFFLYEIYPLILTFLLISAQHSLLCIFSRSPLSIFQKDVKNQPRSFWGHRRLSLISGLKYHLKRIFARICGFRMSFRKTSTNFTLDCLFRQQQKGKILKPSAKIGTKWIRYWLKVIVWLADNYLQIRILLYISVMSIGIDVMPIRIWIGIKMESRIRILPLVLHMLTNPKKLTFIHSNAS